MHPTSPHGAIEAGCCLQADTGVMPAGRSGKALGQDPEGRLLAFICIDVF
jgi:hypothetical protein